MKLPGRQVEQRRFRLFSRARQWVTGIVLLCILFFPIVVQAQSRADSLTELTVDLWPDYDRPAVLVLLTGRLPAEMALPARVTLPLPADATLNAVARLTPEGAMMDDIDYTVEDNALSITVPTERFRVEYYVPYDTTGDERGYRFVWRADDLSVEQLAVMVQQPAAAITMETTPDALSTREGSDGLTYFLLPPDTVLAGDSYSIEFVYRAIGDQLTVQVQESAPPELEPSAPAESSTGTSGLNTYWPVLLVVVGGLLIVAAIGWQIVSSRQSARRTPRKPSRIARRPQPARTQQAPSGAPKGSVQFCHQCGQSVQSDDKFCRNCGAQLRGK